VNQTRADFSSLLSHDFWSLGVNRSSKVLFFFGLINSCIGSCVDDELGPDTSDGPAYLLGLGKIELSTIKGDDVTQTRQKDRKLGAYLPPFANQQDRWFHAAAQRRRNSPSRLLRQHNLASLSDKGRIEARPRT
jgi:hypothetical protein